MTTRKLVNRRQFLAACSGLATTAFLSACGAGTGAPSAAATTGAAQGGATAEAAGTAATNSGPAPQGGKEIHLLIRDDILSAYAADKAAQDWNKQFGSKITLDKPAGDPSQKIQAAQAAGDLIWDGFAVMVVPWDTLTWVKRELIQPLDDLIKSSQIPDATKVVPGIIPSILESTKYQGKQYAIPGNVGSVALAWLTEPLKAANITTPPETWDDVYAAAKKIKAAKPDLTPFDSAGSPLCDLWAMIWGAVDNPFTSDGLVDITSDVSIAALKWMQKMVNEDLMPAIHTDSFKNWQKGGTAIISSFDVAGTMAQQTFGKDSASTGINYFREKGKHHAGTPFWTNSCVVLNKAKNPQGMADFFLWWFGPSNKATGKQITEVAAKPCYQYTYDEFVKGKPDFEWELQGIELVRTSKQFATSTSNSIEQAKTAPWVQKVLDPKVKMDPKQAMEGAMKEIKAEIAKQKV